MLSLTPRTHVYASLASTDMRKSFDGLIGIVEKHLGQNPESGHLYLFFNRRRDRVKVLHFAGDGFVIWYKRLESGTFEPPRSPPPPIADESAGSSTAGAPSPPTCLTMRAADLALILEGIDLASVRRRKRWRRA